MKSKEIIGEGPVDWAQRAAAGVGGFVKGGMAGARAGYQQAASQQDLKAKVRAVLPAWNQAIVAFKNRGMSDEQIAQQMKAWTERYLPVSGLPAYPETKVTPQGAEKYLLQAWSIKLTSGGEERPSPEETSPTGPTGPAAPTGPTGPAAPTGATGPTGPVPGDTFKDPAKFKEEWEKYMAAKGPYALISNPALLTVMKNIWMQTGGLRAESKNRKGKLV